MPQTHQEPESHHLDDEAVIELIDKAVKTFRGQYPSLDRALGMYFMARAMGWKPIYLMRDKRKIREAEGILGIDFREHFPEVGPHADKSVAWTLAKKVSSFWRAVRGDYPNVRSSEVIGLPRKSRSR